MRVVLTGTYNSGNKGDAAMELAAAGEIAARFPGAQVTILSPFPAMDRPFYAPVPVADCNRRRLIGATVDLVRAGLWRLLGAPAGGTAERLLLSPAMRLVRAADATVDLSGDMLTEDYGPHVAYSHYIPILRALVLGRPYMLCAQSIGPFRLTRPLARLLIERAAAVSVRDRISYDYLRAIGVRTPRLTETADLAFLLAPAAAARADAILQAEGVGEGEGRPVLGVSVSQLIEAKYRARNPAARETGFVDLMAGTLAAAARRHGARVLLVSHVTGPSAAKDDRRIAARVREALPADVAAHALAGDYRPDELKAVIARCHAFVGARMHANIAALSSGVPTVAISYSHKTPGIMAACGMADFVAPVETMTAAGLAALLDRAFAEHATLAADLARNVAAVRARAAANFDVLAALAAPAPAAQPSAAPQEARG